MRAFHLPSRPAADRPATARPTRLAELLPDGPCLFVTDRDVVALGLTDACREALRKRPARSSCSTRSRPIRRRKRLLAAVELGRRQASRHVVGFGGGSPMDVAKLAAYLLGSGDDLDAIWGVDSRKGAAPAAGAGPDHRRNRLRSDADLGHHLRGRGEARGQCAAADRRLGGARRRR